MNNSNSSINMFNGLLKKMFALKYAFIGCVLLFCILAFLYNKYSPKVYEVNASIILNKSNRSSLLSSNEMFRNIDLLQSNANMENEVNCLKTFSPVYKTVIALNLEIGYFEEQEGLIKRASDMYLKSPFLITIDKSHPQAIDSKFYIDVLSDSTFRLSVSNKKAMLYNYIDNDVTDQTSLLDKKVYKFNETVTTENYKFSVALNKDRWNKTDKNRYYFVLYHLDYITKAYLANLKVDAISPLSSVIDISFRGENEQKNIAFLNKYIELYFDENLTKKNNTAQSTIEFIDSQISEVSDSLNSAESTLRDYRSANKVMDISFQGQKIYDQLTALETEKSNLLVQKRYYSYIIDYFNKTNASSDLIPPTQMNVEDPVMNQLILDMITLNKERANIVNNSQKSLFINEVENKIKRQRETILETVKNNLNTVNLSLNENNYRYNNLSNEISKLPKTELNLVGMERKFKLNNEIYTYLLQKRAEAQISKASNTSDYEIVEPAKFASSFVVLPRTKLNYMLALMLGLLFPAAFIFARDFFNVKIQSVFDIEYLARQRTLGVIYSNKQKGEAVVKERPRSVVAESFRTLRANLFIKLKPGSSYSWLITSSSPREGKTFISFNLAYSIASLGHKTILIDGDLRKPSLHEKFNVDNSIGLSSYLTKKALLEDIIVKIGENLYLIPAGPVLPNPAEFMESEMFERLIYNLRTDFRYVLIDSSPLGVVADSFLLMKYVTSSIFVARCGYTKKDTFREIFGSLKANNVKNCSVVLNNVDPGKSGIEKQYIRYAGEKVSTVMS